MQLVVKYFVIGLFSLVWGPVLSQNLDTKQAEFVRWVHNQPAQWIDRFYFNDSDKNTLTLMDGRHNKDKPIIFMRSRHAPMLPGDPIFDSSARTFFQVTIGRELIQTEKTDAEADIFVTTMVDVLRSSSLQNDFGLKDISKFLFQIQQDKGCSVYFNKKNGLIKRTLAVFEASYTPQNTYLSIKQTACEAKGLLAHLGLPLDIDIDKHWDVIGIFSESSDNYGCDSFSFHQAKQRAKLLRATGWDESPQKPHLVLLSELRPLFFPFYGENLSGSFGKISAGQSRAEVMKLLEKGFADNEYQPIGIDIINGEGEKYAF